jgi:hypothetical protein
MVLVHDVATWCERGDSNPHTFRYQILSLARLPIPPLSQNMKIEDCRERLQPCGIVWGLGIGGLGLVVRDWGLGIGD